VLSVVQLFIDIQDIFVVKLFVKDVGISFDIELFEDTLGCTCRLRLKCDDTRAETRFRLSAKRTSPFKSAGGGGVSSVDYWQPGGAHRRY
jgi:hypothetical protein